MDFVTWINGIVDEWIKTGRSEAQLAREIGISPATLNAAKNRSRGLPKNREIIDALIDYFKDEHPEIYDLLHAPRPNPYSVLGGLPKGFIEAAIAAHSEYIETISSKGISKDSPEALEISKKILEKHGISFTE